MKIEQKKKAIDLRKKGYSLKEIVKQLGVSKASVSVWVRDVELSDKQKDKLAKSSFSAVAVEKRRQSRLNNEKTKRDKVELEASLDFDHISDRDLKIIGAMLYWAEGGKTKRGMARISNSDPELIRVMMHFFRKICKVPEDKFRGHIHTHSHLKVNEAELYWSKITSIPREQFFKSYYKPSIASKNKRDSLPYGTFDIYVCDTKLFLTIMGWLKKIKYLTLNKK